MNTQRSYPDGWFESSVDDHVVTVSLCHRTANLGAGVEPNLPVIRQTLIAVVYNAR